MSNIKDAISKVATIVNKGEDATHTIRTATSTFLARLKNPLELVKQILDRKLNDKAYIIEYPNYDGVFNYYLDCDFAKVPRLSEKRVQKIVAAIMEIIRESFFVDDTPVKFAVYRNNQKPNNKHLYSNIAVTHYFRDRMNLVIKKSLKERFPVFELTEEELKEIVDMRAQGLRTIETIKRDNNTSALIEDRYVVDEFFNPELKEIPLIDRMLMHSVYGHKADDWEALPIEVDDESISVLLEETYYEPKIIDFGGQWEDLLGDTYTVDGAFLKKFLSAYAGWNCDSRWHSVKSAVASCIPICEEEEEIYDAVYDIFDEWSSTGLRYNEEHNDRLFKRMTRSEKDYEQTGIFTLHGLFCIGMKDKFVKQKLLELFPPGGKIFYAEDYQDFESETLDKAGLQKLRHFLKQSFAFVFNGGNHFYMTRNYDERYDLDYWVRQDDKMALWKTVPIFYKKMKMVKVKNEQTGKREEVEQEVVEESTLMNFIEHNRKQFSFKRFDFMPYLAEQPACMANSLNLFTGFPLYDPEMVIDMNKIDPIIWHLKHILASGDEKHSEYLLNWLSHIIQKPGKKTGKALVFKSKEGTGKSAFWEWMISVVVPRKYGVVVNKLSKIGDKFNSRFQGKLFGLFEESLWGGDAQLNDTMKGTITAPMIEIEFKGKECYEIHDFMSYIFLSNNDHPVAVAPGDRRFVVFECSTEKRDDKEYCIKLEEMTRADSPLAQEIAPHFLNWLARRDISKFNINDIPHSELKQELKEKSLKISYRYLLESLRGNTDLDFCEYDDKKNPTGKPRPITISAKKLWSDFVDWAKDSNNEIRYYTQASFNKEIKSLLNLKEFKTIRIGGKTERGLILNRVDIIAALRDEFRNPTFDVPMPTAAESEPKEIKEVMEDVDSEDEQTSP